MLLDTLTINHIKKKNIQGIQKFKGVFFLKKKYYTNWVCVIQNYMIS
jgi:hypothetical protein